MKLTPEEASNLIQFVNRCVMKCSVCKSNGFELADKVFTLKELRSQYLNAADYPVIPLSCKNCGNTYFLNALVWTRRT